MKEFYISSTKYTIQERKTQKNGKVYDVVFRIVTQDGTEKQKKLSGYKTKKLASEAYTDFVTQNCELLKGAKKITAAKVAKNEPTLAELYRIYVQYISSVNKESVIYDKIKTMDRYVMPKFGDRRPSTITEEEIREWQSDVFAHIVRDGKKISHKYACKIRSFFSDFYKWANETYKIPNPFKNVRIPPKSKNEPKNKRKKTGKFWKESEMSAFISAVDDPKYKCLFTVMLYTGHRKGEIFSLKEEDFIPSRENCQKIRFHSSITRKTLDNTTWKENSTKEGKDQVVPVCKRVRDALAEYKGEFPYYFGGEKPAAEQTVTRRFKKYTEAAGLPEITEHGMRHSFVSLLAHQKASIFVIAELVGDEPEQILRTYGHFYDDDMIEAVGKIV